MNTVILPDQNAVAKWTADHLTNVLAEHPSSAIGLAGGSTPKVVHQELATRSVDWSNALTWMTDERWVPPGHPDSNQRMVRESLIDAVGADFLAPDATDPDPRDAASAFAEELVAAGVGGNRRSLAMLGMGKDGHCASLFPGTTALADTAAYAATWVQQHDTWRLTTTYPFLALSAEILFLVTGAGKADMIGQIAEGADVPSAHVVAESVTWVLDEAAAANL